MKKGWEIKRLSEIGKVYNGNSINEKVKKDNYSDLDDGFPYIATKDISYNSEINYENGIKIPFSEKNSFKIAPKNTVLICAEGGSAGRKIGFTNQEVCFGNKLFALATKNDIESRYVYYYYFSETFQKHFSVELAGIIGGVSMNKFKDLEIPLPPLPEQQRIVAILDEALAAIAKAKANAEQNLKNSKELFESYLQGMFEKKGEDWEDNILKDVCELKSGTTISPSLERTEGDVLYTKVGDMNLPDNEVEINTSSRFVNSREIKINQIIPQGAIIFPKRGGAIATNKKRKIIKPTIVDLNTMAIIPSKKIDNDYFFHWFQLFDLNSISNGANIPQINNYSFDEVYIPYPKSIREQQLIVQKLNTLSTETKKLETIYQTKIKDLEELKKSVLQKAFSGELKTAKALV